MNPKLVACMFLSVLVGGACAGATIVAGWGILAGLVVYSAAGSATLVPAAIWAAHEPKPKAHAKVRSGHVTA